MNWNLQVYLSFLLYIALVSSIYFYHISLGIWSAMQLCNMVTVVISIGKIIANNSPQRDHCGVNNHVIGTKIMLDVSLSVIVEETIAQKC